MSTYSGDVNTMTLAQLEAALHDLAKNWTNAPHLSNDYSESVRYGEIRDALKDRFNISKRIDLVGGANYQVV